MHCLNMWILREHGLWWMGLNFSRKQSVLTGLQQWVVPKERILMWTSCKSYIKSALLVLICCLGPTLCIAATFGLAMPTTTPYLFIYLFVYLFILFIIPSYFDIQIQFPKFQFSHLFIQSLLFSLLLLFYLLIYLFICF